MIRIGTFVCALLLLFSGVAGARPIRPADVFALVSASDPVFAPDGKRIAFLITRTNVPKDRYDRELAIVDIASGALRVIVRQPTVAAPAFSPDGKTITYIVADRQKHGQIEALPVGGGTPRRLTKTHNGVQQYAWRPDGSAIAYVTQNDDPNAAAKKKHHDFFELGDDDYLTQNVAPPSHVWLIDAHGRGARRLTSGTWSLVTAYPPSPPASPLSWSPDGASLLFTRVPDTRDGDAYRSQIMRLDVASGRLTPLTTHGRFEGFAVYSPDGNHVAYLYNRNGDPNSENDVMLAPASGGSGIDVSRKLDRAIFRAQWYPDGKALLVGSHDGTRTALYRLALDGSFTRLAIGDTDPSWFFWIDTALDRHGAIVYPGSLPHAPTELWYRAADGGAPRRLTNLNAATRRLTLGRVQTIDWTNDGFREDGVLTYPPDFHAGKKYPLVLEVHGGPQAATTDSFSSTSQLFASHGYVVFEPNYRGSDNFGNAYEHAIYMDAGAGPGRDVMAGVAAVEKLGFVDTNRIAVGGWSYGGYMTSWLMSHYHIWRTAISGAAVNNWVDMYNLGDGNVQIGFTFRGSPYVGDNRADYTAQSPITYAAQTTCPVLIVSDTGDVRVPISQSYEMFHTLHDNHIPVHFVGIPVGGHYPSDPVRRNDIDELWMRWLDAHMK